MRVITSLTIAAVLIAGGAAAAAVEPAPRPVGQTLDVAPWVTVWSESARKSLPVTSSSWPSALVETNFYAYEDGDEIDQDVFLSARANGYMDPVVLYFYWQDADTGAKRYYNVFQGLLDEGEVSDLFSFGTDPLRVFAPTVDELKLFGADGAAFGAAPNLPLGHYAWVLEIRTPDGEVLASDYGLYNVVGSVETVTGNITSDTTWTADTLYVMGATIFVQNGATLTIEPGTVVLGGIDRSAVVVEPGARIMAVGTDMKPIVFTSPQERGDRSAGDWGGIIIAGNAPINVTGGTSNVEGFEQVTYGGDQPHESSGYLRYVRIEFGGFEFNPDNELNGLALHGVGDGTVIDHMQVISNADDGIEWFGGTADCKYMIFTGNYDDSVDCTEGAQFKIQHLVVVQEGSIDADHGFEFDNWENDNDATPRVFAEIYNATLVGSADTGDRGDDGMKIRRGTGGAFYNFIVTGFRETGLDVDDEATHIQANNGGLVFGNSIMYGNGSYTGQPNIKEDAEGSWQGSDVWFTQDMPMNRVVDPMLADPFFNFVPNLVPLPGSPARDASYVQAPPSDGFFDQVDYLGGVDPSDDWTRAPWVNWSLK